MSSDLAEGINADVQKQRASEKLRLKELFLKLGRKLQPWEVLALEERGNRSEDWSKIRVEEKFRPEAYENNYFYGENFLSLQEDSVVIQGQEQKCLVENCRFKQCHLERGLSLRQIDWMERVYVSSAVQIWRVSRIEHVTDHWTERMTISVGSEVQGRALEVIPEIDPFQLQKSLDVVDWKTSFEVCTMDFSVVSGQVRIEGATMLQNVYLSEGTSIFGAHEIKDVVTLSSLEEQVYIGVGVSARQTFLQWGCRLDRSAIVEKALLFEQSSVDLQGIVIESCLGSNTHVAKGEITACFVGPFVGMHHQSLLIGTLWPEGKGNIGYGANVGSNHTGRAPDQEFWAGEGEFFGLSSSVKFPGNHRNAAFSILATGVTLPPSKMELPFSLILQAQNFAGEVQAELELIPAWMLLHNRYSLVRSSWKTQSRNKSKRYQFTSHYLNPRSVNSMIKALEFLQSLPDKSCYSKEDLPMFPGAMMRREKVQEAMEAYREALEFYVSLEKAEASIKAEILEKFNISQASAERMVELKQKEYDLAMESLEKDRKRGKQITPNYDDFHPKAELDPCLLQLKQSILEQ